MSVYSTRVYLGTPSGSSETLYTVPGSKLFVVRDIEVRNSNSGGTATATYGVDSGGGDVFCITSGTIAASSSWRWDGRLVLNAGDKLRQSATNTNRVAISGYLLDA